MTRKMEKKAKKFLRPKQMPDIGPVMATLGVRKMIFCKETVNDVNKTRKSLKGSSNDVNKTKKCLNGCKMLTNEYCILFILMFIIILR